VLFRSNLRRKLQLQREARKIEDGLEKARIEGKVSSEAYYTAKSVAFKTRNGMSTAKASKLTTVKTTSEKTLGQKRTAYDQIKKARASRKTRKNEQNSVKVPRDITNVKGSREAFEKSPAGKEALKKERRIKIKSLLKEAQKVKDFERSSKDLTNVVAYRRAAATPKSKATLDDVGRMLNKNRKISIKKKNLEVTEEIEDVSGQQITSSKLRRKQFRKTSTRRQLSNSGSQKSVKLHDAQFETYNGRQKRTLRNAASRLMHDSERAYLSDTKITTSPNASKSKSRSLKGAEEGYFIKAELNNSKISKQKQINRMKKAIEKAYLDETPQSKKSISARASEQTEIGSGRQKMLLKTEEVKKPKQSLKLAKKSRQKMELKPEEVQKPRQSLKFARKSRQKAQPKFKQEGRQKFAQRFRITGTVMKEIEKKKQPQRALMPGVSIPEFRQRPMTVNLKGIVNVRDLTKTINQLKIASSQISTLSPGQIPKQINKIAPKTPQLFKPGVIVPPVPSQITKPDMITPQKVDQIIKPGVIIPPLSGQIIKPGLVTPQKVDPILKPVVDEITKVISISHTAKPKSKFIEHVVIEQAITRRKKPRNQANVEKDPRYRAKLQRKIQNRLGSLESMFEGSVSKRAVKKPSSAATKKQAAKRIVKRVRRA
ncbi:MAG: hypothetical protein LLF94_08840, partial [Chlamydiales bacterium]|nr:hypothetical protein [Chlamydiales bacterium]